VSQPISEQTVTIEDEGEVIASFSFKVTEAGDVRHMLVTANTQSNAKVAPEFVDWMKRVLTAQAEMVTQGLHVRASDFPDLIGDVHAFHARFGQEYMGKVRQLPRDLHDFRTKFHEEETGEYADEYEKLCDAIARGDRRDILNCLELQLDALCDAAWVILGTADLQFGRDKTYEAWRRIVKANMAKIRKDATVEGDGSRDSGREAKYDIVKPAGWMAPDHRDLVMDNAIFDEMGETPKEDQN
jgi:predicted HAD superfamily Cof-like phosphohydrolase